MKIELTLKEIDALIDAIEIQLFNPSRFGKKEMLNSLESVKTKLNKYKEEIYGSSVGRKGWKK